jgi:putative transposase
VAKKKVECLTLDEKRGLIEREENSALSVRQQCELLGLNRSTLYYEAAPWNKDDLRLMNAIDEEFTKRPCLGVRQMVWKMRDRGFTVGKKRIRTLMRHIGLFPIFPTKNTSKPNPAHQVFPYLLRDVTVDRVNQVWSVDITYIRLGHGFAYLVAIMDWHSRYVIAWRLSNTLTADFCVECLKDALQYGQPAIFNTDQGCQFTSEEFIRVLQEAGIAISMDGRGRALDNIFVERLWRTIKYEDVYIKLYQTIPEAHKGLKEYFDYYNMERRHSSLDHKTPWTVFSGLELTGPEVAVPQKI